MVPTDFTFNNLVAMNIYQIDLFLDRHHAWRSQDPTLDIWSNFMKKKKKKRKAFYLLLKQTI